MAINTTVTCDNCGHVLRNDMDESGAQPEPHVTLDFSITKSDASKVRPFFRDLCVTCGKKYLKILKEPI